MTDIASAEANTPPPPPPRRTYSVGKPLMLRLVGPLIRGHKGPSLRSMPVQWPPLQCHSITLGAIHLRTLVATTEHN